MKGHTTIINSGSGNIFSVQSALDRINEPNLISADPSVISKSSRLILPGVGTFGQLMRQLSELSCIDSIKTHIYLNKPILGICVGLQVMMDQGFENGEYIGLDLIKGKCLHLKDLTDRSNKTPSIGWKKVSRENTDWFESDFMSTFYHVHSYAIMPEDDSVIKSTYEFHGWEIPAFINKDNIFGVQFHPERSGLAGLEFLKRFCAIS